MNRLQGMSGLLGTAGVIVAAVLLFAPGLVTASEPVASLVVALEAVDPQTVVVALSVVAGLALTLASRRMTHTAPEDVAPPGHDRAPNDGQPIDGQRGDGHHAGRRQGDGQQGGGEDRDGPIVDTVTAVFDGESENPPELVTDGARSTQAPLDRLVEVAIDDSDETAGDVRGEITGGDWGERGSGARSDGSIGANGEGAVGTSHEAMAAVRDHLRKTAADVYRQRHGDDGETARVAVATGTWTDDRIAAAFLGGDDGPTTPISARLRRWLDPASERERRLRRTVAALSRLAEEGR